MWLCMLSLCSSFWPGFSYGSQKKDFDIILRYPKQQADPQGLSLSHWQKVGEISILHKPTLFFLLCPFSAFPQANPNQMHFSRNPQMLTLQKSRLVCHLYSYIPLMSHLWNRFPCIHCIMLHISVPINTSSTSTIYSTCVKSFPFCSSPANCDIFFVLFLRSLSLCHTLW